MNPVVPVIAAQPMMMQQQPMMMQQQPMMMQQQPMMLVQQQYQQAKYGQLSRSEYKALNKEQRRANKRNTKAQRQALKYNGMSRAQYKALTKQQRRSSRRQRGVGGLGQPIVQTGMVGQPMLVAGQPMTQATTVLPNAGLGMMGHHTGGVPLTGLEQQQFALMQQQQMVGQPLVGQQMATNVIQHAPIIDRSVDVVQQVEVRREHHIQPVIHEREHQIQPVIQTQVTTQQQHIVQDQTTMLPTMVGQTTNLGMVGGQTGLVGGQQTLVGQPMVGQTTGVVGGQQAGHVGIGQKLKNALHHNQGTNNQI